MEMTLWKSFEKSFDNIESEFTEEDGKLKKKRERLRNRT